MKKRKFSLQNILIAAATAALLATATGAVAFGKEADAAVDLIWKSYDTYLSEVTGDEKRQAEVTNKEDLHAAAEEPLSEYFDDPNGYSVCSMDYNGKTMKYLMTVSGDPDENGKYPLYITLHGGGNADQSENDEQWYDMFNYYRFGVPDGIYVSCRGIEDTWNLHFLPESYYFYDRLIENMIAFYNADPNQVYLLGFSAGGDGVYAITPRMADRFAAANTSSGHPNGERLLNIANVPFCIQAGIRDYLTEDAARSVRAAEFEDTLNDYAQKYGFGYRHSVLIHVPEGHNYQDFYYYQPAEQTVLKDPASFAQRAVSENWLGYFREVLTAQLGSDYDDVSTISYSMDQSVNDIIYTAVTEHFGMEVENVDADATEFTMQYTRDYAPKNIVWDLSNRADSRSVTSFYWLSADMSVNNGIITASYDEGTNTITVTPDENVNGDFTILFSPFLVDVSSPVTINTPS